MKDREFIELLNLYVDREISAGDALRLEREVASDAERRAIYDQYCRMQKACTMLSEQLLRSAADETTPSVAAFPRQRRWVYVPLAAGLAAALAVAVLSVRNPGGGPAGAPEPTAAARTVPAAAPLAIAGSQAEMKPVFVARLSPDTAQPRAMRALFTASDESARVTDLNWIGDIHMAPVFQAGGPDFLLNPRTDLKSQAITETPDERDSQLTAEMAAFRFQR
jgi:hypothetical protein